MAKYSDIKGFTVQTVSTDPAASAVGAGSWASSNNLNTARNALAGAGTQSANFAAGGAPPNSGSKNNMEVYNGTSWTEVNEINTARRQAGAGGTTTAGILVGGRSSPPAVLDVVESWDGTNWTEIAEINQARDGARGGGTNTSCVFAGGYYPAGPNTYTDETETWNGSAWTEVGDMSNGRAFSAGSGTLTSAILSGGNTAADASIGKAETWNGSAWTEVSDLNTHRGENMGSGASNTDALVFGGFDSPNNLTQTEHWNGSSWTEVSDLANGRRASQGTGTTPAAICAGGYDGSDSAATEEFTAATTFQQTIEGQLFFNSTTNTFKETITDISGTSWVSGNNMNTDRWGNAGAGTLTSGLSINGQNPDTTNLVEEYNGTSWTAISPGIANVVDDSTPQLGGNLDVQTNSIVTTSNRNVLLAPNGTGLVEIKGNDNAGQIQLNCEQNSHGVKIKGPPHSAGQSYTLTLPSSITNDYYLKTDGSGNLSFAAVPTETKPTVADVSQTIAPATATTINITGANFVTVPIVDFINASTGATTRANTVSFTNSTTLSVNLTLASGNYFVRIENPDGNAGRSTNNIITASTAPSFSTGAGSLGTVAAGSSVSLSVAASSDSNVTIAETTSVLTSNANTPAATMNLTLSGTPATSATYNITGTAPSPTGEQTYNFTLSATDVEGQAVTRAFSITVSVGINNSGQIN